MVLAACRGVDVNVFFPARGEITQEGQGAAFVYCRQCVVTDECLGYALRYRIGYGVWGGLTERQRRRVGRHHAV